MIRRHQAPAVKGGWIRLRLQGIACRTLPAVMDSITANLNTAGEDVVMANIQDQQSPIRRELISPDGKKKSSSMHKKFVDILAPLLPGRSKASPRAAAVSDVEHASPTRPLNSCPETHSFQSVPPIATQPDSTLVNPLVSVDAAMSIHENINDPLRTKHSTSSIDGALSIFNMNVDQTGCPQNTAGHVSATVQVNPGAQMSINTPTRAGSVNSQHNVQSIASHSSAPPASSALQTPQLDKLLRAARYCNLPPSPRAEPPVGSPAGTPNQTTLLALSTCLPPRMQRAHWCLEDYIIGEQLYKGYASHVYKAQCKRSLEHVVLKIYTLAAVCDLYKYQIYREVHVHASLQHENIIALHAAFQEGDHIIMVQEYADGSDLFRLLQKYGGRLSERLAVQLILDPFLRVLKYLHTKGIIHRDIKPENILFTKNMTLKLGDFGLAIDLREERAVTRAGTLDYMAPEVLKCPYKSHPVENKEKHGLHYGPHVDSWAVGVLSFELLAGYPPFFDKERKNIELRIVATNPKFPAGISDDAKSFVNQALHKAAIERPTIHEMLQHPWIEQFRARRSMRVTQTVPSQTVERSSAPAANAQAVHNAMNNMQVKAHMVQAQAMTANNVVQQNYGQIHPSMMMPVPYHGTVMMPMHAVPVMQPIVAKLPVQPGQLSAAHMPIANASAFTAAQPAQQKLVNPQQVPVTSRDGAHVSNNINQFFATSRQGSRDMSPFMNLSLQQWQELNAKQQNAPTVQVMARLGTSTSDPQAQ